MIGRSYYLAPPSAGGKDSNNGLSPETPWLTPNHSVNCGDVITAAASSSYDELNFAFGKWGAGAVGCGSGASQGVAWLTCATFDACKFTKAGYGMWVTASNWAFQAGR